MNTDTAREYLYSYFNCLSITEGNYFYTTTAPNNITDEKEQKAYLTSVLGKLSGVVGVFEWSYKNGNWWHLHLASKTALSLVENTVVKPVTDKGGLIAYFSKQVEVLQQPIIYIKPQQIQQTQELQTKLDKEKTQEFLYSLKKELPPSLKKGLLNIIGKAIFLFFPKRKKKIAPIYIYKPLKAMLIKRCVIIYNDS